MIVEISVNCVINANATTIDTIINKRVKGEYFYYRDTSLNFKEALFIEVLADSRESSDLVLYNHIDNLKEKNLEKLKEDANKFYRFHSSHISK